MKWPDLSGAFAASETRLDMVTNFNRFTALIVCWFLDTREVRGKHIALVPRPDLAVTQYNLKLTDMLNPDLYSRF